MKTAVANKFKFSKCSGSCMDSQSLIPKSEKDVHS